MAVAKGEFRLASSLTRQKLTLEDFIEGYLTIWRRLGNPTGQELDIIIYYHDKDFDKQIQKIVSALKGNVYITFDVDVLDPSEMPSTGTPEPTGMQSGQVLKLIKAVAEKKKIIGMDIVELAPIPGINAPDFLTAKLAYKMLGYALYSK